MFPRIRPPRNVRIPRWCLYSTEAPAEIKKKAFEDPRVRQLDKELEDDFAVMRENYSSWLRAMHLGFRIANTHR
jgi:hypothetical protein